MEDSLKPYFVRIKIHGDEGPAYGAPWWNHGEPGPCPPQETCPECGQELECLDADLQPCSCQNLEQAHRAWIESACDQGGEKEALQAYREERILSSRPRPHRARAKGARSINTKRLRLHFEHSPWECLQPHVRVYYQGR